MSRTKRGVTSRAKHKSFQSCKGTMGQKKKHNTYCSSSNGKKHCNMLTGIEEQKKEFRSLWIQRINAGVRAEGLTYSRFINGLNKSKLN